MKEGSAESRVDSGPVCAMTASRLEAVQGMMEALRPEGGSWRLIEIPELCKAGIQLGSIRVALDVGGSSRLTPNALEVTESLLRHCSESALVRVSPHSGEPEPGGVVVVYSGSFGRTPEVLRAAGYTITVPEDALKPAFLYKK